MTASHKTLYRAPHVDRLTLHPESIVFEINETSSVEFRNPSLPIDLSKVIYLSVRSTQKHEITSNSKPMIGAE
jgi:hypothetical protein